jgi:hypothetical protein
MTRPQEFQKAYRATRNTPYLRGSPLALASGGVLAQGKLVWLQSTFSAETRPISISAFVDDIGIITLDPRWLAIANLTNGERGNKAI